jgi:hypothetical protein
VEKGEKDALLYVADIVLPISTFAGTFTLNAFFNIRCPFSLTATCLYSSSILFLSAPLGLLLIDLVVSALPEDE